MAQKLGSQEAYDLGIYLNGNKNRPTPATIQKVLNVAEMLASGKSDVSVRKWLSKDCELSDCSVDDYMAAAYRYLTPKDWNAEKERICAKNIKTLEKIIEKSMNGEKYRMAKEAIDSLNKMMGLYGNGNSVTIGKDNKGDEIIQINFD